MATFRKNHKKNSRVRKRNNKCKAGLILTKNGLCVEPDTIQQHNPDCGPVANQDIVTGMCTEEFEGGGLIRDRRGVVPVQTRVHCENPHPLGSREWGIIQNRCMNSRGRNNNLNVNPPEDFEGGNPGGYSLFEHGYEWTQDVVPKSEWQQKDWMFKQDESGDIDTPFDHGYNWWQDVFHKSEWQQKDWMFRRGGKITRRRRKK